MQSKTNVLSGENVQYAYEALISRTGAFAVRRNRLASAQTTQTPTGAAPQWGDGYGFDGFGNLTDMTPIGTGLNFHTTFAAATNQENGATYDANGNQTWSGSTYDVDNRMKNSGGEFYGYAPDNKRILKSDPWGGGSAQQETHVFFHGLGGERLGEYRLNFTSSTTVSIDLVTGDTWFGSKLLQEGVWKTVQDAKGSVRWRLNTSTNATETTDYYPFGGEKGATTAQNREKFGTYFRDNESGLDYADQRYFNNVSGRFMTADRYKASGGPKNPGSWNRYSYVEGDPVNSNDPHGLDTCIVGVGENAELVECEQVPVVVSSTDPNAGCAFVTGPDDPGWQQCFGGPPPSQAAQNATGGRYKTGGSAALLNNFAIGRSMVAGLASSFAGGTLSQQCNNLLAGLELETGISITDVFNTVASVKLVDMSSSSDTLCSATSPSDSQAYAFWCSAAHQSFTFSQFAPINTGTFAMSTLPDSSTTGTIYFNPLALGTSPFDPMHLAANLIHEAFHQNGALDGALLSALGLPSNGGSAPVTDAIQKSCFP